MPLVEEYSMGEHYLLLMGIGYYGTFDWSDSLTPAMRMTASVRLTFRTIMVDLCV